MNTTPSLKELFAKDGYYLARGVFSPAEIQDLETDFDRIVHQLNRTGGDVNASWQGEQSKKLGAEKTTILHTHNVQIYSEVWHRAFLNVRFLDVVEQIVGPDIVLHHSKLFQKPPEKGAPFPTLKDTMIAGIIHVSDATDEMGCLRVYPGSHTMGRVAGTSGQESSAFLDGYPLDGAVALEAEPGDVAFFHYFTLHGSKPNFSAKTRKTVLAQLHAGSDAVETGNTHPNARLVLRGWNHHAGRALANE